MKLSELLLRKTIWVAFFVSLLAFGNITAAEYIIGPEDVLEISFWQDQQLNTTVRVSLEGKITLDIIGQIEAGGKTT